MAVARECLIRSTSLPNRTIEPRLLEVCSPSRVKAVIDAMQFSTE